MPLVTVELAYKPAFELGAGDADRLIQLHGRDVIWQKERLLNLALAALPEECDKVAWLDSDAILKRADWPQAASRSLGRFGIVQLFHELYDLSPGACLSDVHLATQTPTSP